MGKCNSYHEKNEIIGWSTPDHPITTLVARCYGTKECDICACGGDRTKCDFYPEAREEALKERITCRVCEGPRSCANCYYGTFDSWHCKCCDKLSEWVSLNDRYCRNCGRKLR